MASIEAQDEKKMPKKPEEKLAPDKVLKSEKGTDYLIEKALGAGGFGEVWKVSLLKDPEKRFAMKTEPNFGVEKRLLRLKCEVNLFEAITKASNRIDKTHFVKMIDKGKTTHFKYLVMELIWLSLRDVKVKICGNAFTPHTIIKIARQTLNAIQALHELGFLHRDIKPENFAVGLPPKDGIIYLLDFGIARPYRDDKGAMRKARKEVKFLGTMRYASIECICRREQSMRDDLECWMYMMIELYDPTNIMWSWAEECEPQLHIDLRTQLMEKPRELRASNTLVVPEKWVDIIELLNTMEYEDQGDFRKIHVLLTQIVIDENIDENLPLDWLGKKPPSPQKPKKKKKDNKKVKVPMKNVQPTKGNETDGKTSDQKEPTAEEGSSEESKDSKEEWEEFLKWKKNGKRTKKKMNSCETEEEGKGRKRTEKEKNTLKKKKSRAKASKALTKEDDEPTKEVNEKEKEKEKVEVKKDKETKVVTKKKDQTAESNESTNDRDDKEKKNGTIEGSANDKDEKEKKKDVKKRTTTRTHETKEDEKEEKDETAMQQKKVTKKEINEKKKKKTSQGKTVDQSIEEKKTPQERTVDLKKRKEEKAEKPPPVSLPPDLTKKKKEVLNAKKADNKK